MHCTPVANHIIIIIIDTYKRYDLPAQSQLFNVLQSLHLLHPHYVFIVPYTERVGRTQRFKTDFFQNPLNGVHNILVGFSKLTCSQHFQTQQ